MSLLKASCSAVLAAFSALLSTPSWATVDVSPSWSTVEFTAGAYRVEASAGEPIYRMTELSIWVSGKEVELPRSAFERITLPQLNQITVTVQTQMGRKDGPRKAYISIPFLRSANGDGSLEPGGSWHLFLEGTQFLGSELESRADAANGT